MAQAKRYTMAQVGKVAQSVYDMGEALLQAQRRAAELEGELTTARTKHAAEVAALARKHAAELAAQGRQHAKLLATLRALVPVEVPLVAVRAEEVAAA